MKLRYAITNFAAGKQEKVKQWYRSNIEQSKGVKLFVDNPVQLNDVQTKIVQNLNETGISIINIKELYPDEAWWLKLSAEAGKFTKSNEVQDYIRRFKNNEDTKGSASDYYAKKYLYRKYNVDRKKEVIKFDDLFLQFGLEERVLDTVAGYLRTYCKLRMIDLWYNISRGQEQPVLSQKWHRDGEDVSLVKIFLYFNDVDNENGPFVYVSGSHQKGKYGKLWPPKTIIEQKYGGVYPELEEIDTQISNNDIVTCTGKAGTMIFCDTYGLHRGGHCISGDRIAGNWVYTTPASFCGNVTRYEKPDLNLPDKQKFALSF